MRLKSIDIENITSLKGKHYIDFDQLLKDGELFAITGPTGSGKSSILSAISLALYGKNYKKALDSKDFVTLGTANSTIKLEFETKGETYIATWSLKVLKKNGEPIKKPSPQRILTKDGVAIDESADEIIGLTFDQFIRSVVLNQGQFSKFITSNFSERRKILERLYSENEISELNKQLRENVSNLKQEIDLLKVKLDQGLPYEESEILEAKNELPSATKDKDLYKKQLDNFIVLKQQLKELADNSFKRIDFISKDKDNQKLLTIANDDRNKAILSQKDFASKFDIFKGEYDKKKTKFDKALVIETQITGLEKSIKESINKISENENKLDEINELIKTRNSENDDLIKSKSLLEENNLLGHLELDDLKEIEQIYTQLKSTFENNKIHLANQKTASEELNNLKTEGEAFKEKVANTLNEKEKLDATGLEKTKESLDSKLKKADAQLVELNILSEQSNEYEAQLKTISSSKISEKYKELEEKIQIATEKLNDSTKIFELEQTNISLLEFIEISKDRNECIVCESDISNIKLDKKKESIQSSLKSQVTKDDLNNINEHLNNLQKDLHENQATLKIENKNAGDLKKKIDELTTQLSKKEELQKSKDELTKEKDTITKKIEDAKELDSNLGLLNQKLNSLREDYSKRNKKLEELNGLIEENNKSIDGALKNINSKSDKIDFKTDDFEGLKQNISQAKELQDVKKQIEHNNDFITQIQKQSFETDKSIKQNKENVETSTKTLEDSKKSLSEIIGDNLLKDLVSKLEQEREEKSEKLKELTRAVSKNETNYMRLLTMKDSITDQLKSCENAIMSTLGILNDVLTKVSDYKSSNHETNIFLAKALQIKSYLENQEAVMAIRGANDLLIAEETEFLKTQYELNTQKVTVFEEKIKLFEQKSAEQKKDKEELKKKSTVQERFTNLVEVLGKNKDEFRNFVLGFIEKQLIMATNGELNSICDGRYEIIQKESTHGHEFFILDSWNGGLERKVSTLSGGETFLVSLAMALSLAEMTRGQVDIDCFFIDEGFGSLDKDSIEDAFSALMSVRSRGKQIGIISHVKELTDRIGANIQLNKSNDGQSKIELIFN
jgi:exonuclease SbcC